MFFPSKPKPVTFKIGEYDFFFLGTPLYKATKKIQTPTNIGNSMDLVATDSAS